MVHGDLLDVVLVVVLVVAGISGYRQGFVTGVLSLVGFVGGGVLGTRLAPAVSRALSTLSPAAVGLVVVLLAASLGQLLASGVGVALRRRLRWRVVRRLDATGGLVLSAVPVLFVAWLLGRAVVRSPYVGLVHQVEHSAILTTVDRVVPTSLADLFAGFFRLIDEGGFPALFSGIGQGTFVPVPPPDPAVLTSPALQADRRDIVKIVGLAPSCSRQIEGSGFVYAPDHLITNAHVVAGVTDPSVAVPGIGVFHAQVVLYDPRTDIAVLYLPGLSLAPLSFGAPLPAGANAVVAGYPENGPFSAVAARIRTREDVVGPDIYQNAQVTRQVYALRAVVRPGNSGGPLLSPTGLVEGVVFAASTDQPQTGYALTAAQVAADARAGSAATAPVSTQGCD